jgi:phosphatidylserine decarboxylase
VFTQIAGLLARRIVFWPRIGDRVERGQRVGMIKFSSRTDVLLPPNVQITVKEGQRVRGGTTVIGRIS